MKFSRHVLRVTAIAAAGGALVAASLTGCSGQAGSSDGGSATKGNVTWWSWTPDNDLAAREIAAFNKDYPKIKVTYKKVPIDNYAAVLRPALASKRRTRRLHRERKRFLLRADVRALRLRPDP